MFYNVAISTYKHLFLYGTEILGSSSIRVDLVLQYGLAVYNLLPVKISVLDEFVNANLLYHSLEQTGDPTVELQKTAYFLKIWKK